MDYPLIVALCTLAVLVFFTIPSLFLWRRRQECERAERERLEQTEEIVDEVHARVAAQMRRQVNAALAEQRAAHQAELGAMRRAIAADYGELAAQMSRDRRDVNAALAEHRAALQQEMDAMMKGPIFEAVTHMRDLKAAMSEMRRGLRAPDERVLRPGSKQSPADHPGALIVGLRSRRASSDVAGVLSCGTSQVDRHTLESCCSLANKRPVAPAEAAGQRTIRHDDPRHAARAGPPAAPGPSARSSHVQQVRVDPTPTPVPGISRGGAARTRREARGSQSTAPALTGPPGDSAALVAPRNHRSASGSAEVPSSLKRCSSKLASCAPRVGALTQASFSASAPVLPVAAAASAPRTRYDEVRKRRGAVASGHTQGRRAQEPQTRYPPLSALLNGMEHKRRAAPTQGRHSLSSGSLFYAEMVRRQVLQEARAKIRAAGGGEDEEGLRTA